MLMSDAQTVSAMHGLHQLFNNQKKTVYRAALGFKLVCIRRESHKVLSNPYRLTSQR